MITYIPHEFDQSGQLTPATNLLNSSAQMLVNTVNCEGVMGKGIAKAFKDHYPTMFQEYRRFCLADKFQPGMIWPYHLPDDRIILNVATKGKWKEDSQLTWVLDILTKLPSICQHSHISSIALPPLGCGNGNLPWQAIGPLICSYLDIPDLDVQIYLPQGWRQYQLSYPSRSVAHTPRSPYQKGVTHS